MCACLYIKHPLFFVGKSEILVYVVQTFYLRNILDLVFDKIND